MPTDKRQLAENYLLRYQQTGDNIRKTGDKIRELRQKLLYTGGNYSGNVRTATRQTESRTEKIIIKIISLEERFTNEQLEQYTIYCDILQKLTELSETEYYIVLSEYYLNGQTNGQIARLLDYTPDYIRRLKRVALLELADILQSTPTPTADTQQTENNYFSYADADARQI